MAIKSLAVKYRPMTFDDVVEQDSIKIILRQQLATNTTKNAYLFCGGAGTGKTTCARIFANEINRYKGNPIEMDAASNSGVDDVREIVHQAKTKSLDSDYKVFIVDECFPANTTIDTCGGHKRIQDIRTDDYVLSMSGYKKVTHLFKNKVLTNRLCCVILNDRKVITTVEHPFFTSKGWVRACDLQGGDVVYDSEDVQELWTRVHERTGQRYSVLLSKLRQSVQLEQCTPKDEGTSLSGVQSDCADTKLLKEENMFGEVRKCVSQEVVFTVDEYRIWDGISETVIRKNVTGQSYDTHGLREENVEDQRGEWYSASLYCGTGWKREVHTSTDSLVASIGRWLETGIFDRTAQHGLSSKRISFELQSRPWFTDTESCSRSRWSCPQVEKLFIEGCKEDRVSEELGVESVEIYKRGNNDELFRDSFTDTELSGKFVTMYDIEVEDDHSYCANGVLVHNCHSISNTGWQAFLKLIEEPPAKSIFIFCTTDPQKIPKTILSRVQRYDFQRISHRGIVDRLDYICQKEYDESLEGAVDVDALEYLSKVADGGMRDAITLMDKCLSYSADLTIYNVVKALGIADYGIMISLANSVIVDREPGDIIKIVEGVHRAGKDLKQFIKTFTNFILDLNKYACLRSFEYLETPAIYIKDVESISKNEEACVHLLSTLIKLNADIKWETSPKSVIEAVLILEVTDDRTE